MCLRCQPAAKEVICLLRADLRVRGLLSAATVGSACSTLPLGTSSSSSSFSPGFLGQTVTLVPDMAGKSVIAIIDSVDESALTNKQLYCGLECTHNGIFANVMDG